MSTPNAEPASPSADKLALLASWAASVADTPHATSTDA